MVFRASSSLYVLLVGVIWGFQGLSAAPTCVTDTMQSYEQLGACQIGDSIVTITLSDFYFTAKNVIGSEALAQPNQVLVTPLFSDFGTEQVVNIEFTSTNGGVFQASGNDENLYTFNYTVDPAPPMILGQGLQDLPTDPGTVYLTADLCLGAANSPSAYVSSTFSCPTGNVVTLMTGSSSPPASTTFPPVSTLGVFITADLQGQGGYAHMYGIDSSTIVAPAMVITTVPEPAYLGLSGAVVGFLILGPCKRRAAITAAAQEKAMAARCCFLKER